MAYQHIAERILTYCEPSDLYMVTINSLSFRKLVIGFYLNSKQAKENYEKICKFYLDQANNPLQVNTIREKMTISLEKLPFTLKINQLPYQELHGIYDTTSLLHRTEIIDSQRSSFLRSFVPIYEP